MKKSSRPRSAWLSVLTRNKRRDAGELPAFEPLEERAAGSRNIEELIGDTGSVQSRDGIAAAGDAEQLSGARQLADFSRHRYGPTIEGRCLEGAERPIPDQGTRLLEERIDARHRP